jgi:hypothetical protein
VQGLAVHSSLRAVCGGTGRGRRADVSHQHGC